METSSIEVTPGKLEVAIRGSWSWAEVLRRLGYGSVSGGVQSRLKHLAEDHGFSTAHFTGQGWRSNEAAVEVPVPFTREASDVQLHRVGLSVAAQWFLSRGYMVSVPLETTYDLIAESDRGLERIQVKTSRCKDHGRSYYVGLTCRLYDNEARSTPSTGKYRARPYRRGEVDFFFVYAANGARYLVPFDVVEGQRGISLGNKYAGYRLDD